MARPATRTRLVGATAALLLLTAAAACSNPDPDGDAATATGAAGAAFPVTIAHKYGSTTVTAEPKRVVTVGLTDQDAVLALGVVPVGTTEWLGGYPGAVGPWAQDKLGSAAKPEVLTEADGGPQFEKITNLKPDLILALYSGLTQESYNTLSQIAPTVAQPKEYNDYGIPWQEQTKTIGKVLGKSTQAEKLVTDVEALFTKARDEHTEFKGKTALIATPYEGYFIYGSEDPRSRVLTSLGLTLPPDLDSIIGDKFGASVSTERVDLLDRDVIVWILTNVDTDSAKLHSEKLYADLKVVKEGREVLVGETTTYGTATSFVTVLSLPYLLERLVPQLAEAIDGNPATKVTPKS